MPWRGGAGAGFTPPGTTPWLPIGDNDAINVEIQRDDPGSILTFCRACWRCDGRRGAASRDVRAARVTGRCLGLPEGDGDDRRPQFSSVVQRVDVIGEVLFSTADDLTAVTDDGLQLRPWEGVVVAV